MINSSLQTGVFPSNLKIGKITPIHKKDEYNIFENYRPISILPTLSKIFEKIVHTQIYDYFQSNDLLFASQYGFRPNHSTESAAIDFVDFLKEKLIKAMYQ